MITDHMIVLACREPEGESRIVLTPAATRKLVALGIEVQVEAGLGATLFIGDEEYTAAGATIAPELESALAGADVVLRLNPPTPYFVRSMRPGSLLVSFLDPFLKPELVRALAETGVDSLCMELVPRSTYAQKMDALSSQASLAGYAAVILAAERIDKVLPMMSTPAGTIAPARVFVVGVGVAGLQAIATAKRLGARVSAYDTRPVVEEQVQSLGARFVKIDVGESGQTEQGYARELTEEQLESQRQQMQAICAESDIVITTAQVFGRPAPKIISETMVAAMRPGSIIVDLAASSGGNVEGTVPGKETLVNGVRLIGLNSFPALVARDASQMYASNISNLLEHAFNRETGTLELDDPADEVTRSALLTRGGEIRHEGVRNAVEAEA